MGTKQADGTWLVAIPGLDKKVDVGLKVLFNSLNKKEIEIQLDPISLDLPLAKTLQRGFDAQGARDRRSGASAAGRRRTTRHRAGPGGRATRTTGECAGRGRSRGARCVAARRPFARDLGMDRDGLDRLRRDRVVGVGLSAFASGVAGRPLDAALGAYRAALAAAAPKPPAAATT